jgi:hypothetical protein
MKYTILAVSLLIASPAGAQSSRDTNWYNPDRSYQPPSYQQRFDPPKYDDDYYRSRGYVGTPPFGSGNHPDWQDR